MNLHTSASTPEIISCKLTKSSLARRLCKSNEDCNNSKYLPEKGSAGIWCNSSVSLFPPSLFFSSALKDNNLIPPQTIEDFGTELLFSWKSRFVLFLAIASLAVYQYQTAQIREITGLWPHVMMALLVWVPDLYARGTVRT